MNMSNWTDSIYSDGTADFVSSRTPSLGEKISIRLRFLEDSPAQHVFLRRHTNGAEEYLEMAKTEVKAGLAYYEAETVMNEPRLDYSFMIACEDIIYFYNQAGVKTYFQDDSHNFVLLSSAVYKQPDWVKGAVYYQIFPTSFKDHSLYGVVEKLPYLKELGVTAIYLNPIFTAPSEHKYDCADYFHVDESLGGDQALEALCKAVHDNDMRIILDISINHTGLEYSWVKEKRHFYYKDRDGSLKGWAGFKGLPVLDYRNEELRDIIYRNKDSVLRKWLRPPYDIDGWRFDVADVFGRNDDVQLADELWREVCDAIRQEKEDAMIIGEHWGDCTDYLQGDLWNAPMNYAGFGRIIRQFAGLPDLFLGRNEILNSIPYKETAEDVAARADEFYTKLPQVIAECNMNLFDSHDVSRAHNNEEITFEKWRSIVISQLLFTGIPCIYYGDELGIDGYTEHDSGFRFKMPWDEEEARKESEFYTTYHKMALLRRKHRAFSEGGRKVLLTDGRTIVTSRFMEDEIYIGVISMDDKAKKIQIPTYLVGACEPCGNTDEFGRTFEGKLLENGLYELTVPGESALLIRMGTRK